jgi:hypothetical protein
MPCCIGRREGWDNETALVCGGGGVGGGGSGFGGGRSEFAELDLAGDFEWLSVGVAGDLQLGVWDYRFGAGVVHVGDSGELVSPFRGHHALRGFGEYLVAVGFGAVLAECVLCVHFDVGGCAVGLEVHSFHWIGAVMELKGCVLSHWDWEALRLCREYVERGVGVEQLKEFDWGWVSFPVFLGVLRTFVLAGACTGFHRRRRRERLLCFVEQVRRSYRLVGT